MGLPEHPPFGGAKLRDLPMNQVDIAKVIFPKSMPMAHGGLQKEAE